MYVLQVIARMNVGGTAQYLSHLVNGLLDNSVKTVIATGFTQNGEIEDAVAAELPILRIKYFGRRISLVNDFKARNEIKKIIQEEQPDIIHTHTFKAGLLVRSLNLKTPVIHTFHGHLLDDPEFAGVKRQLIVKIEKLLSKKSRKLVTVGEKVSTDLLAVGIGKSEQFVSIPPGVEPLKLIDKNVARANFDLPSDATVCGWLARFAPVKNPQMMVEIAKEFSNVDFIMGGSGDLFDSVKASASPNLHVFGWVNAAEFLSSIDFLVSTSFNEGMPVAFIEAQMAGIPVIATDVGSVSEVVEDGESGRVVPLNNIMTTISEYLTSSTQQELFKQNATTSGARFSVDNLVRKHLSLYKSI